MRVLVVEDHKELAATIAVGLRREGMAVDIAFDGAAGARAGRLERLRRRRARPRPARSSTATRSAARSSPGGVARAGADADRLRHDRAPGRRAQPRRRRLPAEAVRLRRARRAHPRARPAQPARAAAGARPRAISGSTRPSGSQAAAGAGSSSSPKELAVLELLLAADGAPLSAERAARSRLGRVRRLASATSSRSRSAGCGASSATRR